MRRFLRWSGAALAAFLVVSIVVHVPFVQHAMGWTNRDGTAACPFGRGAARTASTPAPVRAGPRARSRPALGFTLAKTTRDEILAWARDHHVTCASKRGGTQLDCASIPAELLADHGGDLAGTSTWFELDEQGVLHTIKTVRRTHDVGRVAKAFVATETALTARAGAFSESSGTPDPALLASGAFQQASRIYQFRDYRAVIRATNLGDGFVLTESYSL